MKYIKIDITEYVLIVTITREEKLNALNSQLLDELENILNEHRDNNAIRCLIITGSGTKAFAAGADIKEMSKFTNNSAASYSSKGINLFNSIESYSKPIIAAINGYALGGGLELALSCHIRYSSNRSVLGLPEVSLGLIPGYGGTQRLRNIIGIYCGCY